MLDNRIQTKSYGKIFLNSLPDYDKTTDLDEVARFFGR